MRLSLAWYFWAIGSIVIDVQDGHVLFNLLAGSGVGGADTLHAMGDSEWFVLGAWGHVWDFRDSQRWPRRGSGHLE
jgi:hypothetical protein